MDPIQSLTWKIAMINLDQYHTISNILVFALIATLGFTIYRAIKQKLKKKLTKKRIKNLTVFILEVFIVGLAVFAYFHVIMHGKVFFPYEETDVKYFNGFHYIIEEADYNSHSTTVGIGYYAVPIALMRLFSINNILSLYNFVNLFLLCQLLIIAYLIYFFFKDKSSRLKAAVAVAAILMYPSTLVIVRYLRSIYTIVFISTLSSYILMKACSKKNSRIEFHILFSLNYALGCLTRPEFVILNFPILLNYIINQYKNHKSGTEWDLKKYALIGIILITLSFNIFPASRLLNIIETRQDGGRLTHNFNHILRYYENIDFLNTPSMVTFLLIGLLFLFKSVIYYGIIYFISLIRLMDSLQFENVLFSFYFLIAAIIIIDKVIKKKYFYFISIGLIIFGIIVIDNNFSQITTETGEGELEFYNEFKDKDVVLYTTYPNIYFGYMFKDDKPEVKEINEIIEQTEKEQFLLVHDCTGIVVDGKELEFEVIRPVGFFINLCRPVRT